MYPLAILGFLGIFRTLGLRVTLEGTEHIPAEGGAIIACNHVGYLDFTFVGLGARVNHRLVRFMAKEGVFRHPLAGPLMRSMHHIPVNRVAGSRAFTDALALLRAGEVVGIFPEATISRSFTLKDFKPGAARLAQAAGVPLVPAVVWGSQRIYTKGRPVSLRPRGKAVTVAFGEPLRLGRHDDPEAGVVELRHRMSVLLDRVRSEYPDSPSRPEDEWWLPSVLGGAAPTPQEAAVLDDARAAARQAGAKAAEAAETERPGGPEGPDTP
ncbi:MAG: hypothetical protein QG622_1389 [Actinomycetota bacterium]|nr:hypothetical protein [Actinomycetota bacterium]